MKYALDRPGILTILPGDPMAAEHYRTLSPNASSCVGCGHCDSRCPFHVNQSARMQEIREYFA